MSVDPRILGRVRRTMDRVTIAALATVSPDGTPWNSPVYVAFDGRAFYWCSRHDAVHSANIARNPTVFLVVFDSTAEDGSGHAVYVRATARELRDQRVIAAGLDTLARRKNESPRPSEDFVNPCAECVYEAVPDAAWTNVVRGEQEDAHDERIVIDLQALRP